MSALLRSAKGANTYSTELREAIVTSNTLSFPQWTKGITASNSSVSPGGTVTFNININSPDWEQEIAHYFYYGIKNSHATDSLNFKQGPKYHFEQMVITVNDSASTITLKLPAICEIMSDWFLNKGLRMYEERYFCFEEFNTFNGISVGPNSTKYFYYPLDMFISFAGTCVKGEIRNLKFDLTVLSEQSNAAKASKYATCSGTTNLWTVSNLSMVNLTYIRNFALIQDPNLRISLIGSLPSNVPLRHFTLNVPMPIEKTIYTGPLMTGQTVNLKASDIYKGRKIQAFSVWGRKIGTAFNDANACMEYSGPNHIGYKVRQLNTGGNEKELDLTDGRRMKQYAMNQYNNRYGRVQLPQAFWDTPSELMSKYFVRMTQITFDWLQEEQMHEVERTIDTSLQDWDITIVALSDIGTNCELCVCPVIAETYDYDKKTGLLQML